MFKKCTRLWREAHFQVKSVKILGVRTSFWRSDVERVYVAVARTPFPSQKCQKLWGSDHFWTVRCRFAWHAQGILHLVKVRKKWRFVDFVAVSTTTTNTLHYTRLHSTTLHYTRLHSTTLHYTPPHYTTLHYATLRYTTLHDTTIHSITLHYNYSANYK